MPNDRTDGNRRTVFTRQPLDPGLRRSIYGPIQPLERPGILRRLLGYL